MHIHVLFNKSKIYIKTLKKLLHVSITIILREHHTLFLAKVTVQNHSQFKNTHWVFLNCNFSKEQCMHPEDDRVIETCRSVLSVLM